MSLSNSMLTLCLIASQIFFEVSKIIWNFDYFLLLWLGTKIIQKLIGNIPVGINLEWYFGKLLGWRIRQALKELHLMTVFCKQPK